MLGISTRQTTVTAVVLLLVTAGVGPWAASAATAAEIDSCSDIDESGTYVVTRDLHGGDPFTDPCLVVMRAT